MTWLLPSSIPQGPGVEKYIIISRRLGSCGGGGITTNKRKKLQRLLDGGQGYINKYVYGGGTRRYNCVYPAI